jgi:membrane fusion protein (multidrug efflux system)
MLKRFIIALVLVVLVCGGLIGFNVFRAQMIAGFFANQQMPAVTVSATEVAPTTWIPEIEAIGTLLAVQGVDVATEVAGVVKSIEFQANQDVEAGDLLVQIEDAVERADLASAQAAVERDRAQLERVRTLRETGVSSEQTLETAQTALATSESALARIQAVIDQKAIEAPFAGTMGIPRIDVGKYVQPGDVIATLQQIGTMRVDFTVPEQRISDISIDQPAIFGLSEEAFSYQGRIRGIDPKIDPQTRMVSVRAEVENPGGELRPGQFVRVRVKLPAVADVIALPQTSVVTSLYGDYVYVVEQAEEAAATPADAAATPADAAAEAPAESEAETAAENTPDAETTAAPEEASAAPAEREAPATEDAAPQLVARQVFVQIGRRQGNLIEIVEGIEAGQTVITSGQNKLANNMPVVINNETDPAAVALGDGNGRT